MSEITSDDIAYIREQMLPRAEWPVIPMGHPQVILYFAVSGGAVKIGVTGDLLRREAALRSANPVPVRIVAVAKGDRWLERRLHGLFARLHIHGEWFRHEGELAKLLELTP